MKFYRYIVYRIYNSLKDKKAYMTILTTIAGIFALIHLFQLLTIYAFFLKIFPQISIFNMDYQTYVWCGFMIFIALHLIFIARKNRVKNYYEEFKDESLSSKRKGKILIILYFYGSFALLVLVLILLFNK